MMQLKLAKFENIQFGIIGACTDVWRDTYVVQAPTIPKRKKVAPNPMVSVTLTKDIATMKADV